jgi:hypothetical protein
MRSRPAWRWPTALSRQPSEAPVLVMTAERPAGHQVKRALGHVFGVVARESR